MDRVCGRGSRAQKKGVLHQPIKLITCDAHHNSSPARLASVFCKFIMAMNTIIRPAMKKPRLGQSSSLLVSSSCKVWEPGRVGQVPVGF